MGLYLQEEFLILAARAMKNTSDKEEAEQFINTIATILKKIYGID